MCEILYQLKVYLLYKIFFQICKDLSIIFMGDSRIRALFGSTLAAFYGETKVHRFLDDGTPQVLLK